MASQYWIAIEDTADMDEIQVHVEKVLHWTKLPTEKHAG